VATWALLIGSSLFALWALVWSIRSARWLRRTQGYVEDWRARLDAMGPCDLCGKKWDGCTCPVWCSGCETYQPANRLHDCARPYALAPKERP
jgi:hypothetical protein